VGHITTKGRDNEWTGESSGIAQYPQDLDVVAAAETALIRLLTRSESRAVELAGIVSTGIFRDADEGTTR